MSRDQILERPEKEVRPERDSFWRLPRATTRLVVLAAETQDGIEQGLAPASCFESNRQYWLQIHDQIQPLVTRRFSDDNFRRLPVSDKRLLEELDGIKLDFYGAMAASWKLDEDTPLPVLVSAGEEAAAPSGSERPWASQSLADIASRRQHRLNLAAKTDFEHLWIDWLVASSRVHPLQVGYDNYKLQIAELEDMTNSTKGLIDDMHSREYLEIVGSSDSLIEKQLERLNSTTTRARAAYTRAQQAA